MEAKALAAGLISLGLIASPALAQIQQQRTAGGCAPAQTSGGMCFSPGTNFETWTAAAFECGKAGGHVPSLGELVAFRSTVAAAQTDIECSANFDIGAGSIWCVGKGGAISGTSIANAGDLSTHKALYRCVIPLK